MERRRNPSNVSTLNVQQIAQIKQKRLAATTCRSVDLYEKIEKIGEGNYGEVFVARDKLTNETVALKKIRMELQKEGFPITAIRELKLLKELRHENIVQLKEVVIAPGSPDVYMVFEYFWRPTPAHVKCYMKQLLEGLHYCHSKGVLHRDIKASNVLIDNNGQLKLADFGLARAYNPTRMEHYTNRVITLWYRPPELLLGSVHYGPAVDMWSVGCIFAEMLTRKALFPGRNEVEQLDSIFKKTGTPTAEEWPDYPKMPWYSLLHKPSQVYERTLTDYFKTFNLPVEVIDLLERMLVLDPAKRITATQALNHDYFWTLPLPTEKSALPKYPTSHEMQAKKRRAERTGEVGKRIKVQ